MTEITPKYPDVRVRLVGNDGNAFSIMGRVQDALARYLRRNTEMTAQEIQAEKDAYWREATSGDYDNLLRVTMQWVATEAYDPDIGEDWDL